MIQGFRISFYRHYGNPEGTKVKLDQFTRSFVSSWKFYKCDTSMTQTGLESKDKRRAKTHRLTEFNVSFPSNKIIYINNNLAYCQMNTAHMTSQEKMTLA